MTSVSPLAIIENSWSKVLHEVYPMIDLRDDALHVRRDGREGRRVRCVQVQELEVADYSLF